MMDEIRFAYFFHQDIYPAEDYLVLVCDPFSFFVIKYHLVDKGEFFCLGQFYSFLIRITIATIKRGGFAAFKAKINFIVFDDSEYATISQSGNNSFLIRQQFPDQETISQSKQWFLLSSAHCFCLNALPVKIPTYNHCLLRQLDYSVLHSFIARFVENMSILKTH